MSEKPNQWYIDAQDRRRKDLMLALQIRAWFKIIVGVLVVLAIIKYLA